MTHDHHPVPTGDHEGAIVDDTLPRPRIVALGAYERDNFGDLLYREIMRDLFAPTVDVEFAAPFASDGDVDVDPVVAAGPLLREGAVDAIWTVGGEVGATDLAYVYMTSFGDDPAASLEGLAARERDAALRRRTGGVLFDAPYIPRPSALAETRDALLVLNSVGLAGIPHQPAWRRAQLAATLREAAYLSVRDSRSSGFLDRADIPHRLEPDLVHALAHLRPAGEATGHVLLHLSDFQLRSHSVDIWASAIAASSALRDRPLRLFIAGTAPGHDSVSAAEEIVSRVRTIRPDGDVAVSDARGVWPRVDAISGAALWIGSSLHGRIIAQAYGVPRVSFAKGKVDTYASTWDPDLPAGATPATLDSAVEAALSSASTPAVELADRALQSVEDARQVVVAGVGPDLFAVRVDEAASFAEIGRAQQQELDQERAELARLRGELVAARKEAADARHELDAVRSSTTWRVARSITRVAGGLRRR